MDENVADEMWEDYLKRWAELGRILDKARAKCGECFVGRHDDCWRKECQCTCRGNG